MLTIFTTPKPFKGHDGVIQRNALGSWVRLHPECEVILFGDEFGAAEAAQESGIRHVPGVERSESSAKRLDFIFACARKMARHDLLCYANCDVILLPCFAKALRRVAAWSSQFLMVGRRWDTPIAAPLNFAAADWQLHVRDFALGSGKKQRADAVDFFAFSRGLYVDMPHFVVGRIYWDHWLVWKARSLNVPVVDAGADVMAIHQNHDYAYHAAGLEGIRNDPESKRNRALAGGQLHLYTIDHATHQLISGRIASKPGRWHIPFTHLVRIYSGQLWYRLLNATLGIRRALGLSRGAQAPPQPHVQSANRVKAAEE